MVLVSCLFGVYSWFVMMQGRLTVNWRSTALQNRVFKKAGFCCGVLSLRMSSNVKVQIAKILQCFLWTRHCYCITLASSGCGGIWRTEVQGMVPVREDPVVPCSCLKATDTNVVSRLTWRSTFQQILLWLYRSFLLCHQVPPVLRKVWI